MNLRRISLGIGANIYDKMAIAAAQLAMVPVLALQWGIEVFGAWLLLATIPSFLAISDLGFATAAGTRMTMAVARGERDGAVRLFHSAWLIMLASSALAGVLALAAVWAVPAWVLPQAGAFPADQARLTLALLVGYALVSLQASIFHAGLRCDGYFALAGLWNGTAVLAESLAAIAVALAGGGPVAAAATLLAVRLVAVLLEAMLMRRTVPWLTIGLGKARSDEARELVRPALAVMALPLGQACALQGTVLALGAAAGGAAVPAFVAARTLSRVGLQVTQLAVRALMPEYSAAAAREDRGAMAAMLLATLASAAIILTPFALLLGLAGPQLVALWTGGAIRVPPGLMPVMALTVVLGGYWTSLSNLILAINRHETFSYAFALLAFLAVPVSYLLARPLGATGAALALAMLDAWMCLLILKLGRRMLATRAELAGAARTILARTDRRRK